MENSSIRTFTVATELQQIESEPLCHLPEQCWIVQNTKAISLWVLRSKGCVFC